MDYARKKKPCPRLSNSFLIVFRRTGQVKRGKKGPFFFRLFDVVSIEQIERFTSGVRGRKRFTPVCSGFVFLFNFLTYGYYFRFAESCKSAETEKSSLVKMRDRVREFSGPVKLKPQ